MGKGGWKGDSARTPRFRCGPHVAVRAVALLGDGALGHLSEQNVLFWNTYSSVAQAEVIKNLDYHQLPAPFHRYYEEAVQELDR